MQMSLDFFINIYRVKLSTCQHKNVLGVKESKAYWHDDFNRNERKIVNVCDNQIKKRISRKEKKNGIEINKKPAKKDNILRNG